MNRHSSSLSKETGTSAPIAGVDLEPRPTRDKLDWLFLAVLALLCWLPRPTFDGPTSVLAPGAMLAITSLYVLWGAKGRRFRRSAGARSDVLILTLATIVAAYALQVVLGGRFGEMEHLFSRVLFFLGIVVTAEWIGQRSVTVRDVYTSLLVGFTALSILIIVQSLTEQSLFGSVGAARTFGQTLPFARNTGVPRSYGELGIIATAAWAAWLTGRHKLPRAIRIASGILVITATIIAQSRSMWFSFLFVTLCYFLLRKNLRPLIAQSLLIVALLAPVAIEIAIPFLESNAVTASILGERTTRRNVDQRLEAIDVAVEFLLQDPARSMLGYGRSAWFAEVEQQVGARLGIHNNYLAHVVFLGVIVGSLSLLVLYIVPAWRLSRRLAASPSQLTVFLAALGAFINLNFYEGWFSPTLAIVLGTLWFAAHSPRPHGDLSTRQSPQGGASRNEDVPAAMA